MSLASLFRDMCIRRKLTLITLLSAGAALFLAALVTAFHQWSTSHAELAEITHSQALIVARNSTSALLANDPKSAGQNLEALGAFDNIELAALYDRQGRLFARFVAAGQKAQPADFLPENEPAHTHPDVDTHADEHEHTHAGHVLTENHLDVIHAIEAGHERIGAIYVRSNLAPIHQKMIWSAVAMAIAALGGMGLALLLIAALHPAITGPIARLVSLMGVISSEKNYALRADDQGKDELATLGREFNDMLAQIQARDSALAQHHAQLEQDVAQRTASLNEAQHIAHLGSWEWDIVNDILVWSDEIYRIFGLAPQQFGASYEAFMQFVHPDDRLRMGESIRQALEQPGPEYSQDHRILLPNGSVRHVHEQGDVTFNEAGQAIRMVGTVQDITERKQFEINLRQRTAFFEALATTSSDGILVVDSQGRKVLQNKRMIELFKISAEIAAAPDDGPQLQFVIDQVVDPQQFGDRVRYLYDHPEESSQDEVVLKDGTILDRYSAPVLDSDGHSFGRIWSFRDITERKRAEEEIRKQQELTTQIIETIPMRIFWKDRELRYLGCNTLFAKDAGLTRPDELTGKSDYDMNWKDRAEMYRADDRLVMDSNTPKLSYDEPQTTPDGGEIWLRTSKAPLVNEVDECIGVLGVYEEITEYKLAAQALEESELKFRTILDSAVDGILVADGQTHKIVIANRAICDMLGYQRDELCRLGLEDIHPQDALPEVQKQFERQMKGEIQGQHDLPVMRKDGSVFFADISTSPLLLAGRPCLVGILHDVTERKRAETELRLFRTLLDNSSDAVEVLDPANLRFLDVNKKECADLGYSREELLTMGVVDIDPFFGPDASRLIQEQLRNTGVARFEGIHRRRDGSTFPVEISSRLIELDRPYLLNIVRDITERKQVEEEIQRLNEELESKVKKRTQQLLKAQEELVRKEKLAVLGQVAGSVGHELRNPLGVMSNAVYFLQTVLSDADETTKEYLNIIKSEIAGSERIVSDLLDSVRTKPPQPEIVDVAELIGQTLGKLTIPPSVSVKLDIPETLPALRVDAMQTHQVFRNLISNGVEAMPQGGTLEIRAVENRQDGTVTVSVQDSGIGMTPEHLAKLFQPLFTTKARGIGLGLVVVKNLTQANGGSVKVDSEEGKGSVFSITLPAVQ